MRNFEMPQQTLFYKSPRPHDRRLGEIAQPTVAADLKKLPSAHVLLGHPDDEGIRLNYGRAGSRGGPEAIRSAFYRLTPGAKQFPTLYDIGDFKVEGSLQSQQQQALEVVTRIFKDHHRLIALGGGHDHAYADVGGFLKFHAQERPLVINLDAHLDVRPLTDSPNSGTPFYQLLEEFDNFDFIEVGVQPHANSLANIEYAKKKKVKVFSFAESHGRIANIFKKIKPRKRPVFLSIDIDVFSAAYAPGASAASPIGLDPHEVLAVLPWVAQKWNIRGLGIYEVSPPLDQDGRTAKLAAILLHTYLLHTKE